MKNQDGNAVTNAEEMATILNNYYASVFTKEGDDVDVVIQEPEVRLDNIEITDEMVKMAISKLKENSASGPDGIPARVIKDSVPKIHG